MLAVVFEGCACRAAFHAGVTEVLAAASLPIGLTAGASSGSIAAAALASGRGATFAETYRATSGRAIVSWRRLFHNRSPFDMSTIVRDALRAALGDGDLRSSPIESLCTVTRLRDFRRLVLSSRDEPDFVQAILGSCFFPVLYGRTIRIRNELVIDGGVTDNLPIGAVVARGGTTILAVVPSHDGTALKRPFRARVHPHAAPVAARVITVHPSKPLAIAAWDLDRQRVHEAIAAGRDAAHRALDTLSRI